MIKSSIIKKVGLGRKAASNVIIDRRVIVDQILLFFFSAFKLVVILPTFRHKEVGKILRNLKGNDRILVRIKTLAWISCSWFLRHRPLSEAGRGEEKMEKEV